MVLCFCNRPAEGSPEKQPVPIPALPVFPQPVKLALQRFGIDDSLPIPTPVRPCTPPHLTSAQADSSSPQPQQSPSRCPIPRIPDFEGLVDSGTDSDDELLQLSRTHASSPMALPAVGSPGPITPKKNSASGAASGSHTDSSSLSPLSSLMNRIGSIGRGSPSQASGACSVPLEAANSTDNLVTAAHRAEVRRLTHKRMQEELQKERQPYSTHSYKRSTMSTIKEDATDPSPRESPSKQPNEQSLDATLSGSPLRKCVEYDVVKSTEDLSVPTAVSRKLEKEGNSFRTEVPDIPESKPGPTAPRAFALQGKARVKLPQGLVVRGGRNHSKNLRDWFRSSLGSDKPEENNAVSKAPTESGSQYVSSAADTTDATPKVGNRTKESSDVTGSLSSVDEDGSIHEACKARVVTLGRLSTSSTHPLRSESAAWGASSGSRQLGLEGRLSQTAKHDRESSDASRISTLNLPSPFLLPLPPSSGPERESRRVLRRTRGSSSNDESIQLSLPSRYFDYAAALEAADAEAALNERSTNDLRKTRPNGAPNVETLAGDLEKMSEDWHRQISQIQKDSPARPVPFHQMRLSQTWPHTMQPPSLKTSQQIEPEDPFKTAESEFDIFEDSARGVDGSLLAPAGRHHSRRDRHTVAFDTRDMDIAWWKETDNKPASAEVHPLLSNPIESKPVTNACDSDHKEIVESVPEVAVSPQVEFPEKQPASVAAKPGTTGFEKVIRARLKKALSRKQISKKAEMSPLPGRSLLKDSLPCDVEADSSLGGQSTVVEASQTPMQSASQSASGSKERLTPGGNEMRFEVSEKDCLQLPESEKESAVELDAQETRAESDTDTFKDMDSIFGAWVNLERSQDTAPATPVKTEKVGATFPVTSGQDSNPNPSIPSTPIATAYAEVKAYISGAFSSPPVPRTILERQHDSPGSSYKDAVSQHDLAAMQPTTNTVRSNFGNAFTLKSDLALPKLALESTAPSSKYNTWSGRANPTKPRLMKSTVQFSSELESIFLGKKRDSRDGKENKENISSVSHAFSGHD